MPEASAPNPQSDADRLNAAADQAIAACGGDAREAVNPAPMLTGWSCMLLPPRGGAAQRS